MPENNLNSLEPAKWVDRFSDALFRYACSRVQDSNLAADLVQDTFLSALRARDTFSGKASEKTWLTAILKNKILDHYRKASTRKESPLVLRSEEAPSYDHFFNSKKMGRWQNSAEPSEWDRVGESAEFYRMMEKCMSALPDKWRGVFTMSIIDDADSKEVCKEFSLSASNFWVIMHRARLQLRECIEKHWIKA